jgi:hypothetical protein
LNLAQNLCPSAAPTPAARSQARSRKISSTDSRLSAPSSTHPPLLASSLLLPEHDSTFRSVPDLLPPSAATCSCERSSPVRLVPPEARDMAYVDAMAEISTLSNHHKDDFPAHYTFDGKPVRMYSASASLKQDDHARETSRNASFCSTMSTSYSGTVLGVDLDLQYDALHSMRSPSSSMPV